MHKKVLELNGEIAETVEKEYFWGHWLIVSLVFVCAPVMVAVLLFNPPPVVEWIFLVGFSGGLLSFIMSMKWAKVRLRAEREKERLYRRGQ